jgi:glycosyltransferase involved in cell wall biosynthesis
MHVGLFTECYRPIQNGVVASVDALARELQAGGHEVTCVTPRMPNYREMQTFVVRVPSLPLPTRTAYRLTIPFVSGERTWRALDRLSIVHTHSAFVTGWMGLRLARRLRLPLVFTYHTQLEEYAHYVPFDARATRSAAAHLTRTYANAADLVVVPTAAMESRLRALGVAARIAVAPTGIDVAQFALARRDDALRARFGVPPGGTMLLSVGRLGREKNVELTLDAFARIGDEGARLVLVGDGLHREALERRAERLGIAARTIFAGEFPRASLPAVYRSADVFVSTSTSETQGLVLVEALAAGLPVVAVDTPQTRDVLDGAGTVTAPEPAALAAALRSALAAALHGVLADHRQRAVPPHVLRRFEERVTARQIVRLYAELIEAAPLGDAAQVRPAPFKKVSVPRAG